jgi:hypothetical protein
VRLGGLDQVKKLMTSSGFEPVTFELIIKKRKKDMILKEAILVWVN